MSRFKLLVDRFAWQALIGLALFNLMRMILISLCGL